MNVATDATEPKWSKETPKESEAKFRLLFEKSPDAMLLFDGDVFVDCNQAAVEMMRCSSKEQLLALDLYDISPARQPNGRLSVEKARDLTTTAFKEGSLRFEWVHRWMDGKDFPVEVLLTAIPLHGKQILHVSWRDISERKQAEEELWEREAQYRSIFESTSDALLIFDFDGTIVEANPAACWMYGYPYEELIGLSGKDIVHPDYYHLFEDFKRQVQANGRFNAQSVDLHKGGSPINVELHGASFSYKGQPHLLAIVRDVTERVLARQMLEQHVEERTRELSTLLEVSRNIASTLELEPLLGLILDQLKAVVDYSGGTILTPEGDDLTVLAHRGPIPQREALQLRFPLESAPVNREVIGRWEPVIIPDVRDNTPLARAFRETAGGRSETTFGYIRSWMGVPLTVKDRVIGMLSLDHGEPNYYSPRQAELALAFANQAAVAIENARLYERAQELAVVEERSRLARDLHDAVTQTLFSASLIAEVLPRIWERNPEEGRRRLDELRELTRGALAEMRTLLLELRPSALVDAALSDLLRQLAESITGRARVPVTVEVEGECTLPPEAKVALYRIAQEALNNVAKHAGASQATVSLQRQPGQVTLRISDDGRGFDPESVPPESLGLGIMRERAEAIGAALNIDSEVGHGTQVVVVWKDTGGEKQL